MHEYTKGKTIRKIPVTDELLLVIKSLKKNCGEFVFSSTRGNRVDGIYIIKREFPKLLEKASIEKITFHSLRHTFAAHFLANGGSLFQLKVMLGHTDIKTTLRYSHLIPSQLDMMRGIVNFSAKNDADSNTNPSNVIALFS